MRSVKGTAVVKNTHFMVNNCFPKIMPFYEIIWKSMAEPVRP